VNTASAITAATAATMPHTLHPDRSLWDREVAAYVQHLTLGGKSPRTIETYQGNLDAWARFLTDTGRSLDPRDATRRDALAFAADQVARFTPNTAKGRIVAVGTFFRWMVAEWSYSGESRRSPFEGVDAPKLPAVRVPVLTEDQVDALLRACEGRSFEALRDRAVLALILSTGLRRNEAAALTVADVDLTVGVVRVVQGKGAKDRLSAFGLVASEALRHYLRARDRHRDHGHPALFLVTPGHGHRGAMSGSGLGAMLARRAQEAGLGHVHLHQLRHTFAHTLLANGAQEGDVMALGGWTTRSMMDRYGADLRQERAVQSYRDPLARRRR